MSSSKYGDIEKEELGKCPNCCFQLTRERKLSKENKEWILSAVEPYPRKRYAALTENNDHEGESWTFYIKYIISNEDEQADWDEAWSILEDRLSRNRSWTLDCTDNTYAEALGAVNNAKSGYMDDNQFAGSIGLKELKQFVKCIQTKGSECRRSIKEWYKGDFCLTCACEEI